LPRLSAYVRPTGTVDEYLAFALALMNHPEQVYLDLLRIPARRALRVDRLLR
jgi:hypothetical protein